MNTVYVTCAYCREDTELSPAEVWIQLEGPRSIRGTYRWFHDCNGAPNIQPCNYETLNVLVAAGCWVEYTGDEAVIDTFTRQLDRVETPADMGFVS